MAITLRDCPRGAKKLENTKYKLYIGDRHAKF